MNRVGDDLLLDALSRQEDYLHASSDAIDVKASAILAAAAFLAVQPAVLLIVEHIPFTVFVMQLVSFIFLCFSVWCAHQALSIQKFPLPGFSETWRDEQIAAATPDATEEDVRKTLLWGLIDQARTRVAQIQLLNDKKLNFVANARIFVTISLVVNVVIVLIILGSRPWV
jgi:hypothetical protein